MIEQIFKCYCQQNVNWHQVLYCSCKGTAIGVCDLAVATTFKEFGYINGKLSLWLFVRNKLIRCLQGIFGACGKLDLLALASFLCPCSEQY